MTFFAFYARNGLKKRVYISIVSDGFCQDYDLHQRLKDYVAKDPTSAGLGKSLAPGKTEVIPPSGDTVDVPFQSAGCRIAVEVKSLISDETDLRRGLFQCAKTLSLTFLIFGLNKRWYFTL